MNIQKDVIRADEAPELSKKLTPGVPISIGDWTYKLSKPRTWIERMLTDVFEVEGWRRKYKGGQRGNSREKLQNKQNRKLATRSKQAILVSSGDSDKQ